MRILAAAKAGFDYNRTQILLKGLEAIGNEVHLHTIPDRNSKCGRELSFLSQEADLVYVPPFRHRDLNFVRKYSKAPVVFDPLISRYLTKVVDYGHYWKAPQKWWVDYKDFRNCDLLLADTQAHLDYFVKTLKMPKKLPKAVVPVGVNTDDYQASGVRKNQKFTLGFYGTFVPLQGVQTIIEAVALLKNEEDLEFKILGTGHQYEDMRKLASVKGLEQSIFKGWVPYQELATELNQFDLAFGIFGKSLKADLVVPNKLYHYAAMGIPCISKESPGVSEVFTNGENLITTNTSPKDLAQRIMELKFEPEKLKAIGANARRLMEKSYSHKGVAKIFMRAVEESGIL